MKSFYTILSLCLLPYALLAGDVRLVSSYGKHKYGRTGILLEQSTASTRAIDYEIYFKRVVPNTFGPEFGPKNIEMTTSNSASNLVVNPHGWAFYFVTESEVWFYDGLGQYRRFQMTAAGLRTSATCSHPMLESLAPRALRRFVRGTTTRLPAAPN